MKRLENKVAVVTQAGSNFGRAIADAYAAEGAHLVLQDWPERAERLEQNVQRARQAGARVVAALYDITTGEQTARLTEQVMREFGKVDVLVNTAMQGGHGIFFDIREAEWDLCIDRGLKSYFLTCQYIGEEMARVGYGKIINVTSIVGHLGSGGAVPWGASRGGVNALTYAVAQSLGEYGVRCVGLARGATESTPYTQEARDERLLRIPFKRLGIEEDMIGPAIFLATAESDWITGSVVYCDGGYGHAAATDREHRATGPKFDRRGTRMSAATRERDWIDADVK
jgi:NAD(P)-dependent dehydrogenase (short-subunit alcohol dehydrogenase family)